MQPNDITHADKLTLEQGYIVFFHEGKLTNGDDYYLYLAVNGAKLQKYYKMLQSKKPPTMAALERIGKVIAFGEGKPSKELMESLARQYGIQNA